jgi:hypothetical protein
MYACTRTYRQYNTAFPRHQWLAKEPQCYVIQCTLPVVFQLTLLWFVTCSLLNTQCYVIQCTLPVVFQLTLLWFVTCSLLNTQHSIILSQIFLDGTCYLSNSKTAYSPGRIKIWFSSDMICWFYTGQYSYKHLIIYSGTSNYGHSN